MAVHPGQLLLKPIWMLFICCQLINQVIYLFPITKAFECFLPCGKLQEGRRYFELSDNIFCLPDFGKVGVEVKGVSFKEHPVNI